MISNPHAGWLTFKLGEFTGAGSYLTNIPIEMLEAFINYWTKSSSLSVYFDEEGSSFMLVANSMSIYIIEEKEVPRLIEIDARLEDLTNELIEDIERDFDKWAVEFVIDEEDIEKNRKELARLLNELKNVIIELNINPIQSSNKEDTLEK